MGKDVCELLKDPKFIFKVADAASTFYGTKNLIQSGPFDNVLDATIVSCAFPGALIVMSILIWLYKIEDTHELIESLFLKIYGVINLLAAYTCMVRMKNFTSFQINLFNPMNCMMVSGLVGGMLMLSEDIYFAYIASD